MLSAPLSSYLSPFGLHYIEEKEQQDAKDYKTTIDICNIFSALSPARPLVGLIRIYKHLDFLSNSNASHQAIGLTQIARGVIELTSYGKFLIIADLIITVIRVMEYFKEKAEANQTSRI